MHSLLSGYRRFRAKEWPAQKPTFETLAETGQSPNALVIACVDSRIDPAMIFDVPPGEILTVRNVANLVPPFERDAAYHGTSAALEFGVRVLNVKHVIVLGHGLCGGVHALLEGAPDNAQDFVGPWMHIADRARAEALRVAAPDERQKTCEQEAIKISLENLMTFPWIAERVNAGTLKLHGAWFDIRDGALAVLGEDGEFREIT